MASRDDATPAGAGAAPLSRARLSDQVARRIAARIVGGEVAVDEPMESESQLALTHGVSKPIIREALRELAAFGLVRIQHGKHTVVREPASWDVLDPTIQAAFTAAGRGDELALQLHELRLILETSSAPRAAEHATQAQRDGLTALVDQLDVAAAARDVPEFLRADRAFHDLIAQASANQALRQV